MNRQYALHSYRAAAGYTSSDPGMLAIHQTFPKCTVPNGFFNPSPVMLTSFLDGASVRCSLWRVGYGLVVVGAAAQFLLLVSRRPCACQSGSQARLGRWAHTLLLLVLDLNAAHLVSLLQCPSVPCRVPHSEALSLPSHVAWWSKEAGRGASRSSVVRLPQGRRLITLNLIRCWHTFF